MTEEELGALTDKELDDLALEVHTEQARRLELVSIPEQMERLNVGYLSATRVADGDSWRQPTGAHDAYPQGWTVAHGGKTWTSTIPANVWEPGVSGWHEVAEPGNEWPDWVQPTGGHDAYNAGARVSHNGEHWVSAVAANVWEPGSVGAESLWTKQ